MCLMAVRFPKQSSLNILLPFANPWQDRGKILQLLLFSIGNQATL